MGIVIDGKEYYGIIYKIENIITRKIYIGQTTHPRGFCGRYNYKGIGIERVYNYLSNRACHGTYYNQHLLRSIEKYGMDSFIVDEVFDTAKTKSELNEKERYYIEQFNSFTNGYNRSIGGDTVSGAKKPRGKHSPRSKSVCQISTDGKLVNVWGCISDVEKELNIIGSHITQVCQNKRKLAGGFVWVYEKDYDPTKDYKRVPRAKDTGRGTRPVLLLSEDNEVIEEFYSVNSAGSELGISGQEVSRICAHKAKTIKYNLVYKSEYIEEQRLSVRDSYDKAS